MSAGNAHTSFSRRNYIEQEKLESNDIDSGDEFGISVAINGDRVVVGEHFEDRDALGGAAMNNAGAAYIFREGGDWRLQQQKTKRSDRALWMFSNERGHQRPARCRGASRE
ncbi:MAG: FG-GAP repeat protein [Flavobacteriales bacterium]|nr:FG-GAP repeat protein [Flavobacteriales bacterium]